MQIIQAGDWHSSYTMSHDLLNHIDLVHKNDSVDSNVG